MEVQFGPNSVDEPNLLYKLQRKIKVFNTNDALPNRGYKLVASSSKYALVFVAVPDGLLTVYPLNQLISSEGEAQHLTVQLPEKPTHVDVSCDYELLAITGGQLLTIYKVADFQNSDVAPSMTLKTEVSLSTYVVALQWNPCIPDSIAIAFYDGTLFAAQLQTGQTKKVASKARCLCWSPKGKQLVTGNNDGTLMQYKPDLTPAKSVHAPNLCQGSVLEALAIYWISTFQFAVVFKNATDNSRPALTIINTPKGKPPSCLNFEDICYSMGSNRPWYYYLHGLAQWNIILSSSSNSMEIATLASVDGANWQQWCQSDEARPELPLTDKKVENYPVGLSIDTCAIHQLPWGENETLPHMPLLHVVSQTGLLTIFNVINLKKEAQQVCTPPSLLALPAHAMTSKIPGEVAVEPTPPQPLPAQPVPAQPVTAQPVPVQPVLAQPVPVPKPEPQSSVIQQALRTSQSAGQFSTTATIKVPTYQPQTSAAFNTAPPIQEQKPVVEIKPAPLPQPKQQAPLTPQLTPQQIKENEAIKAAQEKKNQLKANQELKNMLIKEVNDFQMELYNFMVKTRQSQVQLQRDIESMNAAFTTPSIDAEQLKKECSIEELRGAVIQLKLELVRACAVVAEARTHSDAKELHQWTQADPLTTKRVASVKKLAYYVQTQLDQAHKALDQRWNELADRDPENKKRGKLMIRPILDDVYQPLVKQQEILCRQQAVLRTLKNTLKECDIGPVFKSTSLLRSTPFRNKDPLSKLTKNILNMSIEPETKPKKSLLSAQKLDALRDVLSNHKPIKIKPVNVELRQHMATMRENYEKSLKERAQATPANTEEGKPQICTGNLTQVQIKSEPKPTFIEVKQASSAPSFTPVAIGKAGQYPKSTTPAQNVARTLFTDEAKQEPPKPQPVAPQPVSKLSFSSATFAPVTADAKTVLKDLLTNKQANLTAKNNANTFMGQKICSPTAFAQPSAPTPASAPSAVFTSKPIADINNMFSKFQPQHFVPETKPVAKTADKPNVKSSETGEPEDTVASNTEKSVNISVKPINVLGAKSQPLAASTPNVPDVLKTSKVTMKPVEKPIESKENVVEKTENVPAKIVQLPEKKDALKPFGAQATNKAFSFTPTSATVSAASDVKPLDLKKENEETKVAEKSEAASVFGMANITITAVKPQPFAFASTSTTTPTKEETPPKSESEAKPESKPESPSTPSASSVFSAAVASQPKTTPSSSTSSSIFSSTQSSVFGTTTTASIISSPKPVLGATTNAASVFGQTAASTAQSDVTTTASAVFASSAQPVISSAMTSSPVSSTATTPTTAAFGATTTASPLFGASATPAFGTSTASVFGSGASPTSVFASTSASSVFGASPTSQSPVFGAATTAAGPFSSTASPIFGAATTASSIFATASTQASSIFGQASQSVFGATTQASIFGATTQASVFGTPPSQTSVFGSPTQTTQASVFGTPTQSTQSSIFGSPTAVSQASVFGSPQGNQASVFGSPQTTQASLFGAQPTATAQGSLFGSGEANLFASASISTTSAPSQNTGGNIFGGSQSSSAFGSGTTNVFGGFSTFGQSNQSGGSVFGGSATFGQKPATNLWGSGGSTSGFGSTAFGQATTQSSSIFGGSSGGSFSAPSAGAFGTPQPSAFGSPQQQQTSPAFGGSPVFGSKPVFGQSSGFGSPTSSGFGAQASFGGFGNKSPGGAFGAPAAFGGAPTFGGGGSPGGFAAAAQSNATFETLATQNTLTFGNLAQQTSQAPAPAFNTSPSFTGWRG